MQVKQYPTKVFIFLLLVFVSSWHAVFAKAMAGSLAVFEWQNRMILVNTSDVAGKQTVENLFKLHEDALDERHIVWFIVHSEGVVSNYPGNISTSLLGEIKTILSTTPSNNLVLIGKDGGVKSRGNGLSIETIFEQIDQMPMRQYEMEMQNNY